MKNIFKKLFCKHENIEFCGNIYGDLIDHYSTFRHINRSAWRCQDCGRMFFAECFGVIKHETFNEYLEREFMR